MYYAAVLSGDPALQEVFISGGNFHSNIAKKVFKLDCPVEDIEVYHKKERQGCKAISFGILYGASSQKIADTAGLSQREASAIIKDYFNTFWVLKEWIDNTKCDIEKKGYIISPLGRKRRLLNVSSEDKQVKAHELRSGLNAVIQGCASDINLLGAIDMNEYIKSTKMDAKIFALVHDSILAEVNENCIDEYVAAIKQCVQKDRGVSIPGTPVGCDIEIGDDYSMGKFEKYYDSSELQIS